MKIYVLTDEIRKGPFTKAELRKQLLAGKVKRKHLVWHSGIEAWTPLEELSALSRENDGAEDENGEEPVYVMPPMPEAPGGRKRKVYKVRSRTPRPFRDWLLRCLGVAR